MHTACPVHMASAEKIAEPSLPAKTHSPSRPQLPMQASHVKQVPANVSGGLVWGCPHPTAICLPLLRSGELSWPGPRCLIWQFLSENKSHFPLQYLLRPPGAPRQSSSSGLPPPCGMKSIATGHVLSVPSPHHCLDLCYLIMQPLATGGNLNFNVT